MVVFIDLVIVVVFIDLYLLGIPNWLFLLRVACVIVNSLHTLLRRCEKLNRSFFYVRR